VPRSHLAHPRSRDPISSSGGSVPANPLRGGNRCSPSVLRAAPGPAGSQARFAVSLAPLPESVEVAPRPDGQDSCSSTYRPNSRSN